MVVKSFFYCTEENLANEYCPGPDDKVAYYTQVILNGHCEIPCPKPDSEELIEIFPKIDVKKAITVDSVEFRYGREKKGKKVVVSGLVKLGIEYSADESEQKVHYFQCEIPFHALILRCRNGEKRLFRPKFCLENYNVRICVEHIQVDRISERVFEKVVVLMIWLQRKD